MAETEKTLHEDPQKYVTRRTLVRAGWTLPLVLASVSLSRNSFTQYAAGEGAEGDNGPPL